MATCELSMLIRILPAGVSLIDAAVHVHIAATMLTTCKQDRIEEINLYSRKGDI